jgi:hypothetical protein
MGGDTFVVNLYALPLGDYDMALDVQWLGTLGSVLWDIACLTLAFERAGKRILWRGIDATPRPFLAPLTTSSSMPAGRVRRAVRGPSRTFSSTTHMLAHPAQAGWCALAVPHPAQAGWCALAVRPYRYAYAQKDELEQRCDEMLHLGVIRRSSSVFSSPALLIRKHDGTWRFCVDYRVLNDAMTKDKFAIPVVEELLDELRCTKFFTKLSTCASATNQVLMHPVNVGKTTFCTHQGLFEFLVMPFSLSNVPATFQALMNEVC